MLPILHLGSLEIHTYTLMRVAAVAVFAVFVALRLRQGGWPVSPRRLIDALPLLIVGMVVGGWLETLLPHLAALALRGDPLPPLWWAGRRWLGALGGVSLAGYVYARRCQLPVGRSFDLFAVPAPLVLAVARTGCLLAGCCYGKETTAWPALFLPDAGGRWASRYPTQLADIIANLLIFVLLVVGERAARRRNPLAGWPFDGFLFLSFILLHCGQRFVVEFWRAGTPRLVGIFTWSQFFSLVGVGLAVGLMVRLGRPHRS